MSELSANIQDGARLDIAADGFWGSRFERAFFDAKVFNPYAPSCYRTRKRGNMTTASVKFPLHTTPLYISLPLPLPSTQHSPLHITPLYTTLPSNTTPSTHHSPLHTTPLCTPLPQQATPIYTTLPSTLTPSTYHSHLHNTPLS